MEGKKEDIKGESTSDGMLEYVQRLYMHEGVAPIVQNIESPHDTCIDIEYVNKGTKKMAKSKVTDVTLITSELS